MATTTTRRYFACNLCGARARSDGLPEGWIAVEGDERTLGHLCRRCTDAVVDSAGA